MARITVEDCLEHENNRFSLVLLAAKRTKQILRGAGVKIRDTKGNKAVVTALREIAAGEVRFMSPEEKAELDAQLAQERAERELLGAPRSMGDELFTNRPATSAIEPAESVEELGNDSSNQNGHSVS